MNIPIFVLSRDAAERALFLATDYIVSITDPESIPARIQGTTNILRLSFYDIDREITTLDGRVFYPMSNEDAISVAEYVRNIPVSSSIFVHCEAGISRSAGVAAAISMFLNHDDQRFFREYLPNRYCAITLY